MQSIEVSCSRAKQFNTDDVMSRQSPVSNTSLSPVVAQVAEELMTLAYENGINLFDTAEVYAAGK